MFSCPSFVTRENATRIRAPRISSVLLRAITMHTAQYSLVRGLREVVRAIRPRPRDLRHRHRRARLRVFAFGATKLGGAAGLRVHVHVRDGRVKTLRDVYYVYVTIFLRS